MKYFSFLFLILFTVSSCQKAVENDGSLPAVEKSVTDESYGSDPQQKMDIFLPAGRSTTSTNVLVLIHGGAWSEGDKTDFASYMATLKQRLPGYAIFNINYRLAAANKNLFPAQEMDVKAALEYIAAHAADYMVSQKVALLGASAGAHLALLQAYKYHSPIHVKTVIDFFGPADLTAMYNTPINPYIQPVLQSLTGGTPLTKTALYAESSPISYVTAASAPTMILQGGLDPLVDPSQSIALKNKLQAAGVIAEYVFYDNEGHGWTGSNLTDSFNKIELFLKAHMQ